MSMSDSSSVRVSVSDPSSGLEVRLGRVWLSLTLVIGLTAALLTGSAAPAGAVAGYGDVADSSWYTDAVQWSADNAITGIAGVCFEPDTPVSRGETAVWIYNMENQPDTGEPHSFTDVTDASQNDAISWMANNEITTGTTGTTFSPNDTSTRAQAAAFLHRLEGEPASPPHDFSDVVAAWQQDAVSWMAHTGITTGATDATFAPDDTLTRAQLITFLYRYQNEPDTTLDTTTPGCVPAGLVTPTGIPVAVLERTASGFLVRTPCGNTAEVSKGVFINDVRVVIDPGHGGPVDTGAVGPNGLVERDLNLTLARAVIDELARRGISAVSTRTGDYGTLLSVRAALADHLGVEALVSIHHNAPTWATSSIPGSEVFIQSASRDLARADSARLGGLLYEEVTAALATFDGITWSRSASAGVLRVLSSRGSDAYGMIVRPEVPTALIEYGYLSNPSEAALFATDGYIQVAATATADAIDAYLHTERPGTGFIQRPRIYNPGRAPSFCEDPALE